MSNYLPILPRSYNEICCFPTASYPTPSTKRHSRIVILSVSTIVAALIVLISLNYSGDSQLYQDNPIPPLYAYYSKYPKPLLKSEDCADQDATNNKVKEVARVQHFLHSIEFKKAFPCCMTQDSESDTNSISTSDITFVIYSSKGSLNKHGIAAGATWARGLPEKNVIYMTDSYSGNAFTDDTSNIDFVDHEQRQLGALHFINENRKTDEKSELPLPSTDWIFIVPDHTWVNIPILLSTLSAYSPKCPIAIGAVRTNTSMESIDAASIAGGIAISAESMKIVAPKLFTDQCKYVGSFSNSLSRCLWSTQSQLLHESAFSSRQIPKTNDRHKQMDVTLLAQALSFPGNSVADLKYMTTYSYPRHMYDPIKLLIPKPAEDDEKKDDEKKDDEKNVVTDKDEESPLRDYIYHLLRPKGDDFKSFTFDTIKIKKEDITNFTGVVNTNKGPTNVLTYNNTTPFDANIVLYDNPLVPTVLYPTHMYPNSNLLQNAEVGYQFLGITTPVFTPKK